MKVETQSFKNGKANHTFQCGVILKPFMNINRCDELAVAKVTDEFFLFFRVYRIRYGKYHRGSTLPMIHVPLICKKHIEEFQQLPPDPRRTRYNGYQDPWYTDEE